MRIEDIIIFTLLFLILLDMSDIRKEQSELHDFIEKSIVKMKSILK